MGFGIVLLLIASAQASPPPPIGPPPTGKARLIFYRSGAFLLGGRGCSAYLEQDGRAERVAELGRSQYAVYDADPGERALSGSKSLKRPIGLDLKAGSTTFLRCEVIGMMGHSRLVQAHRIEFERYRPQLDAAR